MTNDQDPSSDTFQVVLIELRNVAYNHEIHCVKKPLTKDLKYVAISYRWGELQETSIDTGVGYVATITSFALQDFYYLCDAMTKDPDLQSIPYVWVDAICVNQSDSDERKATIYHMSEIYEQASWILAVPDLHAKHLKAMTNNKRDMDSIKKHQEYLYHLIHGNIDKLHEMDQRFLGELGVPSDEKLRQLLTKHTNCFVKGFMTIQTAHFPFNDDHLLAHLSDSQSTQYTQWYDSSPKPRSDIDDEIISLHRCSGGACPFNAIFHKPYRLVGSNEWHRGIIERRNEVSHAMHFLADLIVDWSSRVWVISEFHISKKKNNLKFWFNQLHIPGRWPLFTLDMNDPRLKAIRNAQVDPSVIPISHAVYHIFYQQLINQLNRQTFLEMMLKSKASKNEDRFYSIFPHFPEYKHLIQNKDLVNTITSIISVKVKLYQVMTNEHKKLLLWLSINGNATFAMPTFATSLINWQDPNSLESIASNISSINVDITLSCDTKGLPYLRLKPSEYWIARRQTCADNATLAKLDRVGEKRTLDAWENFVDVVQHPILGRAYLIGRCADNTWVLGWLAKYDGPPKVFHHRSIENMPDDFPGFRVY